MLFAASESTDAASYARLAVVVLAQVLRVGQHGLEELQRDDLDLDGLGGFIGGSLPHVPCSLFFCERSLVHHFVDAAHADVLNDVEVGEVLLAEGHPETGTLDGGIVDDERLYLFVVEQVALLGADAGIGQGLVNLHRFRLDVLAVLPIESFLRYLADVDFGVEVRGESFMMVARVAIDDVEVLQFVEVVLGGVGGEDAGHTRVEAAAQNGTESGLLETLAVGPLPRVLEVRLVLGFVVGRVEVVAPRLQAGLHDGEVLIRQCQVHHDVGLVAAQQLDELFDAVGIHLRRLDLGAVFLVKDFSQCDALLLRAAGNHDFRERVGVLTHLVSCYGGYTASSDDKYSSHCFALLLLANANLRKKVQSGKTLDFFSLFERCILVVRGEGLEVRGLLWKHVFSNL